MSSQKDPVSNLREIADQLKELLPHWRTYVENPRRLGTWLEEHQPWLSRQFLSAASNLSDPYLAGMGLHVEDLGETRAEVRLPMRWKNQGEGGTVHVGAMTTAAEFVSRLYWERLLNLQRHQLRATQITARFLGEVSTDCKAIFSVSEAERESILFKLRSEGTATAPCPVNIFDEAGKLVAEVQVEWNFSQPKSLGSGQGSETSSVKGKN